MPEWLRNTFKGNHRGWELTDGVLTQLYTENPAAPESVLRMVTCGCKKGCGKRCSCRKAGLDCSALCLICKGHNCVNTTQLEIDFSDT